MNTTMLDYRLRIQMLGPQDPRKQLTTEEKASLGVVRFNALLARYNSACSSLVTSPASSPSLSFGYGVRECRQRAPCSVQAITGAILSYSSSASAPNLDPIAFKEAALARLRMWRCLLSPAPPVRLLLSPSPRVCQASA